MGITMINADAVKWAREYDGPLFHALLCDPPYHLQSIIKRFGNSSPEDVEKNATNRKIEGQGTSPYGRTARGFMGKQWDGGDVAFDPATWEAFSKVMYPGAFGMAFASSRGWHRLACAIEDGGLIIHPSIFGWSYSTGFPKATRIGVCTCGESKKVSKYYMRSVQQADVSQAGSDEKAIGKVLQQSLPEQSIPIETQQLSDNARGKESGMEGRRDLPQSPRELCEREVCSVSSEVFTDGEEGRLHNGTSVSNGGTSESTIESNGSNTPQGSQPIKQLNRKSGIVSKQSNTQNRRSSETCERCGKLLSDVDWSGHRYGLQALKPALEPIIVFQKPYEGRPIDNITASGAGTLNIDAARIGTDEVTGWNGNPSNGYSGGLDSFEEGGRPVQGRWPANFILLDDGAAEALDRQSGASVSGEYKGGGSKNGGIWNPSTGKPAGMEYGDSGGASRFFFRVSEQIDASDPVYYCAKASTEERDAGLSTDLTTINDGCEKSIDNPYQRGETLKHNPHPTVKPIELARYLATLLLPPIEYQPRKLFIPFAGVASEVIGSMQAGWDEITGVELTEEYIPIANARIEYWRNRGWQTSLFDTNAIDHPTAGNLSR